MNSSTTLRPTSSSALAAPGSRDTASAVEGRLDWVDSAKGMGILLVVLGHSLRGMIDDQPHG